jgi:hypothetical protein
MAFVIRFATHSVEIWLTQESPLEWGPQEDAKRYCAEAEAHRAVIGLRLSGCMIHQLVANGDARPPDPGDPEMDRQHSFGRSAGRDAPNVVRFPANVVRFPACRERSHLGRADRHRADPIAANCRTGQNHGEGGDDERSFEARAGAAGQAAAADTAEPPLCGICGEKSLVVLMHGDTVTKLCAVHLSLFDRDAAAVYAKIARLQTD